MATSVAQIRDNFVEHYQSMGYQLLPRSPMTDPSIPMSFVMSAGLVQVEASLARKNIQDGEHFVLSQECFRYFDIEKVGTDGFHLSLFEMPGAFVFGPINKEKTVQDMWHLATDVLQIDQTRIWASYFGGGYILDKHKEKEDAIVRDTWMKVGIPRERIIGLGADHNYWVQGKGIEGLGTIRKCGTNTELFYDLGKEKACRINCKPGCNCGRFLEFSNSLFISGRIGELSNEIHPLDNPFTETVIGAERVDAILQNVDTVFETETFIPIINTIDNFKTSTSWYLEDNTVVIYEQVLADHLRALFRLIADGAPSPGKNGRERIIKILIRRVLAREILLGIDHDVFLPYIINTITSNLPQGSYPSWTTERSIQYFSTERNRFAKTIERGEKQLKALLSKNNGNTLSGAQIMYLEKKWGFPNILTHSYLSIYDLPFNKEEYQQAIKTFTV